MWGRNQNATNFIKVLVSSKKVKLNSACEMTYKAFRKGANGAQFKLKPGKNSMFVVDRNGTYLMRVYDVQTLSFSIAVVAKISSKVYEFTLNIDRWNSVKKGNETMGIDRQCSIHIGSAFRYLKSLEESVKTDNRTIK